MSLASAELVRRTPELGWIELGHDVWVHWDGADLLVTHTRPDGEPCPGQPRSVDISSGTHHRLVSREPLHLEPSLLCPLCGWHGFIHDGKWVPA